MLALVERTVTDLGGRYAIEDTDSMSIGATRRGGSVPCPGGPHMARQGGSSRARLQLGPSRRYRRSILGRKHVRPDCYSRIDPQIEDDNYDPKTKKQRQLGAWRSPPRGMRFSSDIVTVSRRFYARASTVAMIGIPNTVLAIAFAVQQAPGRKVFYDVVFDSHRFYFDILVASGSASLHASFKKMASRSSSRRLPRMS